MGYSFIPFLLLIGSLAVIIVIVARRSSQLSLLDVENLPEVKEEQKKNDYLKKKVEKRAERTRRRMRDMADTVIVPRLRQIQTSFRSFVRKIEKKAAARMRAKQTEKPLTDQYKEKAEIQLMLDEARQALVRGDFEDAERKYIAVIRVESKNIEAYSGLGDVYAGQEHWKEAKATYQFLLQLRPADEHAIVKLAEIAEQEGQTEEAVRYYEQAVLLNDHVATRFVKIAELLTDLGAYDTALEAIEQAVELEPQNPKYLDMMAEVSILVGSRALADKAYRALRMVNPENQKLTVLKDKIDRMPR